MTRRLLLAVVSSALWAAAPPSPESHFGHKMGADRKLLDWDKVVSYFSMLEKASDRITVEDIGRTVQGRTMIAAFIAAPQTIRNLARYRDIQQRLADPRHTPEVDAGRLISAGKTVVMITCSIHSTEVASTSTAAELAYRLLTDNSPKTRAILQDTIFILVPSLNPDGVDIVTRWYRKTLGTPYEGTSPPELYHAYVGHDNNRDWYIFSQPETRNTISRLHNVWHPQIVYDVHQQGAFASRMFVPPWMDPVDPNIDAIIAQLCNAIGAGMAADLTSAGKTGVAVNAMYDFWTPARHYQAYHAGLRILSESASARLATPIDVTRDQILSSALGYDPRQRSWNYLEPWSGGTWRVRDIVDYQLIAMESCLYQAALRRGDLLRSFYEVGKRAVARSSPFAFVVPDVQFDPGSARKLLETLSFGQVEIDRATKPFRAGDRRYAAGSYIIRMQQPYSSWAKTLLERQQYPDLRQYPGGPPKRPYDVTAHTLPVLMGVAVDAVASAFSAESERSAEFEFPPAAGAAPNVLPASDVDSWRAINRAWRSGRRVGRNERGDFILDGGRLLRQPRVALYKSWVPSMDEGWTRWLLEQFGFEYTSVSDQDIRSGSLKKFNVAVFPDQSAARMRDGHGKGVMPDEFTGGLGAQGAEQLRQFAAQGGTLVFLNNASEYALEQLKLPVRNAMSGLSSRDFYSPGSLLNVRLDRAHPLAHGMPENIALWFEGSPAFELEAGSGGRVVASYPESGLLASGWLLGEKYLVKRAALIEVPVGSGRAVLFGMRPQYRAQSYQGFKMFFNALILE